MVSLKDLQRAGGKAPLPKGVYNLEVDQLAKKLVGILAEATTPEIARRAVDKARRMLAVR